MAKRRVLGLKTFRLSSALESNRCLAIQAFQFGKSKVPQQVLVIRISWHGTRLDRPGRVTISEDRGETCLIVTIYDDDLLVCGGSDKKYIRSQLKERSWTITEKNSNGGPYTARQSAFDFVLRVSIAKIGLATALDLEVAPTRMYANSRHHSAAYHFEFAS